MFEIVITADTNDGDYVTEINKITQEELDEIFPVIEAIKKCPEQHNWPAPVEYGFDELKKRYPELSEEQIEIFDAWCPTGEYGIHTIKSIVYYETPKKIKLL